MKRFTVLLLAEDSSRDSEKVLEHLVTRALRLLDAACPTEQIQFEPATGDVKEIARATDWKSENPQNYEKRRRVLSIIADHIARAGEYVVFHFDGDEPWSNQANCDNIKQFESKVRNPIEELLAKPPQKRTNRKSPRPTRGPLEIKLAMAQLLPMVSFHSLESWLYQNTTEAIQICNSPRYKGRDVAQFETWANDRGALDEHAKNDPPKKKICLWSDHNLDLASKGFPTKEVYDVGKSFHSFVEGLRVITMFIQAQRTLQTQQEKVAEWWRDYWKFDESQRPQPKTIEEATRWLKILESDEPLTQEQALEKFLASALV